MDFSEFQGVINKINGIISSKINFEDDSLTEMHILANNLRSAKQIGRDIESSILASFDYRIDRKIISIAQIQAEDNEVNKRIKFSGIYLNSNETSVECCVRLLYDKVEYSEILTRTKTAPNRRKIVADTTIMALEKILCKPLRFEVIEVVVSTKNEINYVTVLVNVVCNDSEETLIGSAIIWSDTNEAISKATLDAINRRLKIIKN
jgi:hypothetical protein